MWQQRCRLPKAASSVEIANVYRIGGKMCRISPLCVCSHAEIKYSNCQERSAE